MSNKCARCKKEIAQSDFICPHCGLIIGDPVSYAIATQKNESKGSKFSLHRMIRCLLIIVLVAVIVTGAFFVYTHFFAQPSMQAKEPAATLPTPPQTTAPLAVYTVQVSTTNKTDLSGAGVNIYSCEQLLYSSQIGSDGSATFILPESDSYSVRLTDLPVQYQVNYGDVFFSFEAGQRDLRVQLEELPVTFTFTVVNSAGEGVPGTAIYFYSSGQEEQMQVSDESGVCRFVADYGTGSHAVSVAYVPDGYVVSSSDEHFTLQKNKLDFEIELHTYEEYGYDAADIYTVRIVDEYGDPVPNFRLAVAGMLTDIDGLGIWKSGMTNAEGCFSFHYEGELWCKVTIPNNADYYDTVFDFDVGQHQMEIQLDLNKEPGTLYTYTVYVVDSVYMPVAGAEIGYMPPDGSAMQYYVSDRLGTVTFQTTVADPSAVKYYITYVPNGYYSPSPDDMEYGFLPYQRSTTVQLLYDGKTQYNIYTVDAEGNPVGNVGLWVYMDGRKLGEKMTDSQGKLSLRWLAGDISVTVSVLPDGYENCGIVNVEYGERNNIYITIAQSNTYTVNFADIETGNPISGVRIAVTDDIYGGKADCYTSDENGQITFESTASDASLVHFYVISCPDDYSAVLFDYYQYGFDTFSKSLIVDMKYDGMVAYKVYLKDVNGQPVTHSIIDFHRSNDGMGSVILDDQGCGSYRLYPNEELKIDWVSFAWVMDAYADYVVSGIEYGEDNTVYITIAPSDVIIPE